MYKKIFIKYFLEGLWTISLALLVIAVIGFNIYAIEETHNMALQITAAVIGFILLWSILWGSFSVSWHASAEDAKNSLDTI